MNMNQDEGTQIPELGIQHLNAKELAVQILRKLKDDIQNNLLTDKVGNDDYLRLMARHFGLQHQDLRQRLGIVTHLHVVTSRLRPRRPPIHVNKLQEQSKMSRAIVSKPISKKTKQDKAVKSDATEVQGPPYKCDYCGIVSLRRWTFIKHLETPTHQQKVKGDYVKRTKRPRCRRCDKSFKTMTDCEHHEKSCTGGHNCKICGKHFARSFNLNRHMNAHNEKKAATTVKKKYHCSVCHVYFRNPWQQNQHLQTPRHKRKKEEQSELSAAVLGNSNEKNDSQLDVRDDDKSEKDNIFHSIFKCIRCGLQVKSQQEMQTHSNVAHAVTIPRESEDWLGILSEENMKKTSCAQIQDTNPNFICCLCHRPFHCMIANKRHVIQCEEDYGIEEKEAKKIYQADVTESVKLPVYRRLDKDLVLKIVAKLKDDVEDFFFKEMAGSEYHLNLIARKLRLKYNCLRRWLGIVTAFNGNKPKNEKSGSLKTFELVIQWGADAEEVVLSLDEEI